MQCNLYCRYFIFQIYSFQVVSFFIVFLSKLRNSISVYFFKFIFFPDNLEQIYKCLLKSCLVVPTPFIFESVPISIFVQVMGHLFLLCITCSTFFNYMLCKGYLVLNWVFLFEDCWVSCWHARD